MLYIFMFAMVFGRLDRLNNQRTFVPIEIIARIVVESMVSFVAQSNLVFQIIILAVLFASLILKKRGNLFLHGSMMMVAAILNAFSFILVMGPSLLNLEELVVNQPLNTISMVTMAHASLGAIAEILAIWVIVSWRLRSSTQYCVRKRKIMRVTLVLWLIAVFLGLLLYAFLYII